MELASFTSLIQNFGALGILAMMVWRLPSVLGAVNNLLQDNVKNVRETQRESLEVFKSENDKVLALVGSRFEASEEILKQLVTSNTAVVHELKALTERVTTLEHDQTS